MYKYFVLAILTSVLFLVALPGFAADGHGDRVCIYKHQGFHGHEQCFRPGDEVSDLKHAEVASIRVFGHARAMLYEDRDFHGRSMDFNGDMPDLNHVPIAGSKEWRDHIGSLRVTSDSAFNTGSIYVPDYGYSRMKPYPESIDEGVCVYDRPDFQGRFQCFASGTEISDLGFGNWRDKISSVRILGHGRVVGYKDKNFRGERIFIDRDAPDLESVPMLESGNWNDEIGSLQVQ